MSDQILLVFGIAGLAVGFALELFNVRRAVNLVDSDVYRLLHEVRVIHAKLDRILSLLPPPNKEIYTATIVPGKVTEKENV